MLSVYVFFSFIVIDSHTFHHILFIIMSSSFHMILHLLLFFYTVFSQKIITSLPGFTGPLPFTLEVGYIGVGESEEVQFFYYFVESAGKPSADPILIWLSGGPACSALTGLFFEIGPLNFDYHNFSGHFPSFMLNPYSWTQISSIIFLDSPVGTGFSYATTPEAYNTSNTLASAQIYEFLRKWFLKHPSFLSCPFYVTGDSYSGLIVPMVVHLVHNGNVAGLLPQMNLQGYALGNPVTVHHDDSNYRVPFANRVGLVSDSLYEAVKNSCHGEYVNIDETNAACVQDMQLVDKCTDKIFIAHILEPLCNLLSPSPGLLKRDKHFMDDVALDFLSSPVQIPELWCRSHNYLLVYIWANDESVRESLGIREGTVEKWFRCNSTVSITEDISSTFDYHKSMGDVVYQGLIYSGDHDLSVPHIATEAWIRNLNFTLYSDWAPWFVDGQISGYTMAYTNKSFMLTYATIKGGGHTAPEYKPIQSFQMIYRWLSNFLL